eukprot:4279655-Alexandrium_andersonii.AAC.1
MYPFKFEHGDQQAYTATPCISGAARRRSVHVRALSGTSGLRPEVPGSARKRPPNVLERA